MCGDYGGTWIEKYSCGPGGCEGDYCRCPEDTSKLWGCLEGTRCDCDPIDSGGCYTLDARWFCFEGILQGKCNTDDDCIIAKGGCCGCEGGGTATVINKDKYQYWMDHLTEDCRDISCITTMSQDLSCFSEPRCVNNICMLRYEGKIRKCPDAWVAYTNDTQFFVIGGHSGDIAYNLEDYDIDWIKKNCEVKEPTIEETPASNAG